MVYLKNIMHVNSFHEKKVPAFNLVNYQEKNDLHSCGTVNVFPIDNSTIGFLFLNKSEANCLVQFLCRRLETEIDNKMINFKR